MLLRKIVLRVIALCFVAMMCTGCCQLLCSTCDLLNCLLSGPPLPGLLSAQEGVFLAHPEGAPRALPRGTVRAAMAY